ncbi:MAG: DUF3098 domain-containing protein [Bacteroidales bacterium]|nr:DUF3098 domain-containing protein [Bacteroidales bacterium]
MATQNKPEVKKHKGQLSWAFTKENYKIMFIGLGFLALGFLLMIGGGSDSITRFEPEIFDFQRITLAPILILIGYAFEFFAIMKLPKEKNND